MKNTFKSHEFNKIDNLLKQIDKDKNILKDWKKDLTSKNHFIDHLRKTFYFTCSVVSLTPRPSGKVYPFDLRWCTASPLLGNSHYETAYDLLMNDRNSTAMTECEIFEELL